MQGSGFVRSMTSKAVNRTNCRIGSAHNTGIQEFDESLLTVAASAVVTSAPIGVVNVSARSVYRILPFTPCFQQRTIVTGFAVATEAAEEIFKERLEKAKSTKFPAEKSFLHLQLCPTLESEAVRLDPKTPESPTKEWHIQDP